MLRGAKSLLSNRRVRILEFEYHGVGPWRSLNLYDTLGWLDGLGYHCFWQVCPLGQISTHARFSRLAPRHERIARR